MIEVPKGTGGYYRLGGMGHKVDRLVIIIHFMAYERDAYSCKENPVIMIIIYCHIRSSPLS